MQLPPIERISNLRPYGAEAASLARVIPVNPPVTQEIPAIEPTPSVINLVNLVNKPSTGEGVYTSVSDPARFGSEAATTPKDWTIHRPKTEEVEDPPPVPISKVLMDHVKSLWTASASAIQIQQVKNELDLSQQNPNAKPFELDTEEPSDPVGKLNKSENI